MIGERGRLKNVAEFSNKIKKKKKNLFADMQTEKLDSIITKANQKAIWRAVGVFTGFVETKILTFIQNYK